MLIVYNMTVCKMENVNIYSFNIDKNWVRMYNALHNHFS